MWLHCFGARIICVYTDQFMGGKTEPKSVAILFEPALPCSDWTAYLKSLLLSLMLSLSNSVKFCNLMTISDYLCIDMLIIFFTAWQYSPTKVWQNKHTIVVWYVWLLCGSRYFNNYSVTWNCNTFSTKWSEAILMLKNVIKLKFSVGIQFVVFATSQLKLEMNEYISSSLTL